jgi:hypothetical protein
MYVSIPSHVPCRSWQDEVTGLCSGNNVGCLLLSGRHLQEQLENTLETVCACVLVCVHLCVCVCAHMRE